MHDEVAAVVRERRKAMGLTQEGLALRLDPPVSAAAVSSWERGYEPIPRGRIDDLARALGVAAEMLIGRDRYVSDNAEARLEYMQAIARAPALGIVARNVLLRLGCSAVLVCDRGEGLEFVGDLASIEAETPYLTLDQIEGAWEELLSSGFVERASGAQWHLRLKFPDDVAG